MDNIQTHNMQTNSTQTNAIGAVRGMSPIMPDDVVLFERFEAIARETLGRFGVREIRPNLVEPLSLFVRSVGESSDIVSKELYEFADKGAQMLALRPEGTAGVMRTAIDRKLTAQGGQKLWYYGPMFRYERPQKGRQRCFHQLGVEYLGFGGEGIAADSPVVECLNILAILFKALDLKDVRLELNSLGSQETRAQYRTALVAYLTPHIARLDVDSQKRLESNPLRILDSKDPATQAILAEAPLLTDYLNNDERAHFEQVQALLQALNIPFTLNPKLVRGLDYYNDVVFEWLAVDGLGAQNAICGGGSYDTLSTQLGAKSPIPATGFAIGVERLLLLMRAQENALCTVPAQLYDWAFVCLEPAAVARAFAYRQQIWQVVNAARIWVPFGARSAKAQFKALDKMGVQQALIIGAQELEEHTLILKDMHEGTQATYSISDAIAVLEQSFSKSHEWHTQN